MDGRETKPTAGITLNGERVNAFHLKKAKRQRQTCSLSLFNIVLASAMQQEKEIKLVQ